MFTSPRYDRQIAGACFVKFSAAVVRVWCDVKMQTTSAVSLARKHNSFTTVPYANTFLGKSAQITLLVVSYRLSPRTTSQKPISLNCTRYECKHARWRLLAAVALIVTPSPCLWNSTVNWFTWVFWKYTCTFTPTMKLPSQGVAMLQVAF